MAKKVEQFGIFDGVKKSLIDVAPPKNSGYKDPSGEDIDFAGFMGIEGIVTYEFPNALWIEPKEWRGMAEYLTEKQLWPQLQRRRIGRFTNQSPTSECTAHAGIQCFEQCYRKMYGLDIRNGIKGQLCLAPLSIYRLTNTSGRGGSYGVKVLKTAVANGVLPEPVRNQDKIFPYTLPGTRGKGNAENSHASRWIPASKDRDKWEPVAQTIRPAEAIIVGGSQALEQVICLVLHQYTVPVGRKGHMVPYDILGWTGNSEYPSRFGYSDSYDRELFDSLSTARRCANTGSTVTSMTRPKLWEDHFYGE